METLPTRNTQSVFQATAGYWQSIFTTPRLYTHPVPKVKEKLSVSDVFSQGGRVPFAPLPEPINIKPKDTHRFGVIAALKPICSTDSFRPAMTGVYFDNAEQAIVATDGFVLVKIPASQGQGFTIDRSEIIHPVTGNVIDETYPRWTMVLPNLDSCNGPVAVESVHNLINRIGPMIRAAKFFDYRHDGEYTTRIYGDSTVCFNPLYVERALKALAITGTTDVEIWITNAKRAAMFRDKDNPEKFAIVMPIVLNNPDGDARVTIWTTLATVN